MPAALLKSRRGLTVLAVLVGCVALVATALGRSGEPEPASPYQQAHGSLCSAAAMAAAGDASGARRLFTDSAHGPLHELAADVSAAGHRAAAARLLEAKESVEGALSAEPSRLSGELADLAEAAAAALVSIGAGEPRCPA